MTRREIDWRSPLAAFAPLAELDGAILLHGGEIAEGARWSFIAACPARRIESVEGATLIDGAYSNVTPFEALSKMHDERRLPAEIKCGAPLASGIIGFAGYECGRFSEPSAKGPPSPYGLPDFSFAAYDAVAAFDRCSKRAFLTGRSPNAVERLEEMLGSGERGRSGEFHFDAPTSNFTRAGYCAAVADVVERIRNGDLFQANISQRLEMRSRAPFDAYEFFVASTAESSGAYGAFLTFAGAKIISLSPERFFTVTPDPPGRLAIAAEPIKGTRPRGTDDEEDARLLAELISDPKDRAENVMIADLTRNDLTKICEDRSIREDAVCEPITHATVHHLVSRISGELRRGISAADALGSLFPCGSITGAPKVEAMKVIAAIERTGRGPYCGAIGYLDDRGGADFSVGIRLAVAEGDVISIPVGGGVTLRSDPCSEYDETLDKARQWLRHSRLEGIERE